MYLKQALLCLSVALPLVQSELVYLNPPNVSWFTGASESYAGNGLFLSPDGMMLAGAFADGSLRFFNLEDGEPAMSPFVPSSLGFSMRGYGGLTFSMGGSTPYMVYAATDDPLNPAGASTRVFGVDMTGNAVFESVPLPGVQAGTPQTSADGRYVLLTHNVDSSTGYFSVLDTTATGANGILNVSYTNVNETNPFSPLGVYHNPAEGYYDGGQGNRNDIFIWGFDTAGSATVVGTGQMFAYQRPTGYMTLGGVRDFQSPTAPVLTNAGRSMYWAVTRSQQKAWTGTALLDRDRFNRGRSQTAAFDRGSPAYIAARASPTLFGSNFEPTVYGPGAAAQVFRMDYNFSSVVTATTTSIVSAKVVVSPQGDVVYFASQDGLLTAGDATTLATIWTRQFNAPIESDMTLNRAGTVLYVADTSGLITALQVANQEGSTTPPTGQPSFAPITGPPQSSSMPTVVPIGGTPTPVLVSFPTPTTDTASDMPSDTPSRVPAASPAGTPTSTPPSAPSAPTADTSAASMWGVSVLTGLLLLVV